jgi:hypothetical protein
MGSAGLDDYCAHFIIGKTPDVFRRVRFHKRNFRFFVKGDILVDQKYVPIYKSFVRKSGARNLPADFEHSEKVEADVHGNGDPGIVIANTGSHINSLLLYTCGPPVFQSESLVLADMKSMEKESVRNVAEALTHSGYSDRERIRSYVEWADLMGLNLGDRWVRKPTIEDMFVDDFDRGSIAMGITVKPDDLEYLREVEEGLISRA